MKKPEPKGRDINNDKENAMSEMTKTEEPVWRQVKRDVYRAMCDRVERECGKREPVASPWDDLPFYQVMDLLAGAVGRMVAEDLRVGRDDE